MIGQLSDRVLLVDDDPLIRKLLSGYLVAAGYVVRTAVDGLDALGKLRAGLPDLIISDLNMPRMSGPELLEVVGKRFPQIPVIIMSADASSETPGGVAADAYHHKSAIGFQQLLETVSDLAKKPPLRAALPQVDKTPIQARRVGDRQYVVNCEDCLREFSVLRALHMGGNVNWATCAHCGAYVRFLAA